jgi:NodT family efflux transporter outer membrane factor (OMF) lipoprotein
MTRALLLALASIHGLCACRVGEDYVPPETAMPARYGGGEEAPVPAPAEEARWWTAFGDPVLDRLVERALASNLDLAIAAQRIREARAAVRIVGGDARPIVDLRAGAVRREPSTAVAGGEFLPDDAAAYYSVGIDARWELDLFGRTARLVEATEAEHDALVEAGRGALLAVLAEVARNYLELRGAEAELRLLERELASQRETVALVGSRVRAGLEVEAALARVRALEAATEASLPVLARRRATHAHALAVLLGSWSGDVLGELEPGEEPGLPTPPDTIASGLPVELLRRRPDLREAERRLARASASSAQAVAELYPRISLGAAFGWESESLDEMFEPPSRMFAVGPTFLTPLIHGGILRWVVRARDAQEEQARLAHERAVLEALREVEDALSAWSRTRARIPALAASRAAQREALELLRERYASGLEDYLGVLDAERGVLLSESAFVRGRVALALSAVALYKALGGGWEAVEGEAPALAAARGTF